MEDRQGSETRNIRNLSSAELRELLPHIDVARRKAHGVDSNLFMIMRSDGSYETSGPLPAPYDILAGGDEYALQFLHGALCFVEELIKNTVDSANNSPRTEGGRIIDGVVEDVIVDPDLF